tara:strand:- start:300 stop:554 length:255 start_codon:yes stop_codon:yes gene_type:complete
MLTLYYQKDGWRHTVKVLLVSPSCFNMPRQLKNRPPLLLRCAQKDWCNLWTRNNTLPKMHTHEKNVTFFLRRIERKVKTGNEGE